MTDDNRIHKIRSMPRIFVTPLKYMLLELGLSQRDLANDLGISETTVSTLLSGKRKPSLEMATKLTIFFREKGFPHINQLVFLYPEDFFQSSNVSSELFSRD